MKNPTNTIGLTGMDQTKEIVARVDACLEMARRSYSMDLPRINILFDLRGKAAGMFCEHGKERFFRFNKGMFEGNFEEFMSQVVPHEVAHYVVRAKWGPRPAPHGSEWKKVMSEVFKLQPDRCHQMDTSVVSPAPYIYACMCREFKIAVRMHNSITRGRRRSCKSCKSTLTFLRYEAPEQPKPKSIERLFVSTGGESITGSTIAKLQKVVAGINIQQLITDALIPTAEGLAMGRKLGISANAVTRHERLDTIPRLISHAIIFDDINTDRQRRMAKACESRGVSVRLLSPVAASAVRLPS